MFLLRPLDGTGAWGLLSRAPLVPKAMFASCLPAPPSSPSLAFGTPLGPWLGSLESGSSRGSCPISTIETPPQPPPLPRPPSARAWQSLVGPTGSAPRLANRGLAPPEVLWPGNH